MVQIRDAPRNGPLHKFIRFRETAARRHGAQGPVASDWRECVGKCKGRRRRYPRQGSGMIVQGSTFLTGCPMRPICPLKEPRRRLEVSIVNTVRESGKVKQRHVASLGSIAGDATVSERQNFWLECEDRLARLGNQPAPDVDRLRQAIAARIPPPTNDERAVMAGAAWNVLETQDSEKDAIPLKDSTRLRQENVALRALTSPIGVPLPPGARMM